jgi:hypothetical protein
MLYACTFLAVSGHIAVVVQVWYSSNLFFLGLVWRLNCWSSLCPELDEEVNEEHYKDEHEEADEDEDEDAEEDRP